MASSVQVFQFIRKIHQAIGLHPSEPQQTQYSLNAENKFFLIALNQYGLTVGAYLVFEANEIVEYAFGFVGLVSIGYIILIYILFIWQQENMLKFFENCERFIEMRVHSTLVYKEVFVKIELFNMLFCCAQIFSASNAYAVTLLHSYVRYYYYDMEEESFYLLIPAWFPFNWRTPFGYMVAYFTQLTGGIALDVVCQQFLNIVFGSCWLFFTIAEDLSHDVATFSADIETSDGNRTALTERFCGLVEMYSNAKSCVTDLNQVYEYPLLVLFISTMLMIASTLVTLQFQLWDDDLSLLETVPPLLILTIVTSWLVFVCEPGARMMEQFEIFGTQIGQFNWYLLPIELQRMYLIFLSDTQNPRQLSSYGDIVCERETLKKILNTAFSYFMTIRKFRA